MRVAITLCHKTKHDRSEDKRQNSFLGGGKAQPLSYFIYFGPALPLQFLAYSCCLEVH
jgi:hypothetical protein